MTDVDFTDKNYFTVVMNFPFLSVFMHFFMYFVDNREIFITAYDLAM